MGSATGRQKELYDAKVHGGEFKVNDLVWLHNPVVARGASQKLHCPWVRPYQVVKKLSTAVFRIQDIRRGKRSRKVVHFDRLKPCSSTVRFPPEHTTPKKKQTAAPEYTDQPAPHLPRSELQFFDEGEDLEQTYPGGDTNPDAGNVEQDEA